MEIETFNNQTLRRLAQIEVNPVVSIYLPTAARDGDPRGSAIQLKNLAAEAERRLNDRGKPNGASVRWLEPVTALEEQADLWRRREEAVAVFRWRGQLDVFHLPHQTPARVHVGDHPYLLPLLEPAARVGRFAVLALSFNHVRLMVCSRRNVERLESDDLPSDYDAALGRYVDTERQLQFHTAGAQAQPRGGGATDAPIYHGHGGGDARDRGTRRREFCQLVDRAVRKLLRDAELPLILAAEDHLAAVYRRVNRYHPLVESTVSGNFDHLSDSSLRDRALPLMEQRVHEAHVAAIRRYRETPPEGVLSSVEEALPAAHDGRVDLLLVRRGDEQWGMFAGGRVTTPAERRPQHEELLNLAACRTLAQRGDVLTLPPEEMPCDAPLCAMLRY